VLATGWTWEYVWENMTLRRLEVMNRLWKDCPPPNISLAKVSAMIAAFLGIESVRSAPKEPPALLNMPDFEE